jgi:hypothetical protein
MVAVEGLDELVSLAAYSSVEWLIWSPKPAVVVERTGAMRNASPRGVGFTFLIIAVDAVLSLWHS